MTSAQAPLPSPIRVSVCMASYRGASYIESQIRSILDELGPEDELVIYDDASPDNTADVVRGFADGRIRLIEGSSNIGYVGAFESAILASRGEFIFLSDQDDVWVPGRVKLMLEALQTAAVVASNFAMLGDGARPWIPPLTASMNFQRIANLFGIMIGYRAYYGCGMAFRRDMIPILIPIPRYVRESHDLWIAICGNMARSIMHLETPTLLRRLHDHNETPAGFRSLRRIAGARLMLARLMFVASRRLRRR